MVPSSELLASLFCSDYIIFSLPRPNNNKPKIPTTNLAKIKINKQNQIKNNLLQLECLFLGGEEPEDRAAYNMTFEVLWLLAILAMFILFFLCLCSFKMHSDDF